MAWEMGDPDSVWKWLPTERRKISKEDGGGGGGCVCIHLCYEYSVVFPTSQTFLPTSAQICVYF